MADGAVAHYFSRMERGDTYKAPITAICACGWRTRPLPKLTEGLIQLDDHARGGIPRQPPGPNDMTFRDWNATVRDHPC